jgi:hypothetical protein
MVKVMPADIMGCDEFLLAAGCLRCVPLACGPDQTTRPRPRQSTANIAITRVLVLRGQAIREIPQIPRALVNFASIVELTSYCVWMPPFGVGGVSCGHWLSGCEVKVKDEVQETGKCAIRSPPSAPFTRRCCQLPQAGRPARADQLKSRLGRTRSYQVLRGASNFVSARSRRCCFRSPIII